jgi:hypothetical protein
LWKTIRRDIGATINALAIPPVRHKLPPQLERTFFTVGLLER